MEQQSSLAGAEDRARGATAVAGSTLGDRPAEVDSLGFEPYVAAIERFLQDEETEPPLVLSVEGEWGSGKSSLMLQLAKRLDPPFSLRGGSTRANEPAQSGDQRAGAPVVWFNAWRQEDGESLWATFALQFFADLRARLPESQAWRADWVLRWRRFDLHRGWPALVKVLCITVAWLVLAVSAVRLLGRGAALSELSEGLAVSGGVAAALLGTLGVLRWIGALLPSPLSVDLARHAESPDYEGRLSFLHQFHEDFDRALQVYGGDSKKIYVFIDDLDRCAAPRAAELMSAIHLMIEHPRVVVVLGMDRERVATGIAIRYEDVLPFLTVGAAAREGESERKQERRLGLDYANHFLGKFIQLSFRVPRADPESLDAFMNALGVEGRGATTPPPAVTESHEFDALHVELRRDSAEVRDVVALVAPTLEFNPRSIKKFLNRFRLTAYLAHATGMFRVREQGGAALTLPQIAKLVVILDVWPGVVRDLEQEPGLLASLEELGSARDLRAALLAPIAMRWGHDLRLRQLICGNPGDRWPVPSEYSLREVDVSRFLRVAPPVEAGELLTPDDASAERSLDSAASWGKADPFSSSEAPRRETQQASKAPRPKAPTAKRAPAKKSKKKAARKKEPRRRA